MQPFLKWAGGKRWLFDGAFISALPPYRRYVEPFLGGGAGFFALQPARALLSDLNADLINLYLTVRDHPKALRKLILQYHDLHSREFYYAMRAHKPRSPIKAAARMLYLNRTCWNGLYRLNRHGDFNVPMGTKTAVSLPSDDFDQLSALLTGVELRICDFADTIRTARSGDLLFVDPPYTVKHNMNGFVKYNERIFSWSDQVRLRDALSGAADRGASIILMNAHHDSIRELYSGFGVQTQVLRKSIISGKTDGRSQISELMVRL